MANETANPIGTFIRLGTDFQTALNTTIEALKAEGFGVLTEIDLQDTLRKKLGVEFGEYRILGACNPPLAHRALSAAPEVGLLLPCNVTVRKLADGEIEVGIIDPLVMLGVVVNPALKTIADEARSRLDRVAQALRDVK